MLYVRDALLDLCPLCILCRRCEHISGSDDARCVTRTTSSRQSSQLKLLHMFLDIFLSSSSRSQYISVEQNSTSNQDELMEKRTVDFFGNGC